MDISLEGSRYEARIFRSSTTARRIILVVLTHIRVVTLCDLRYYPLHLAGWSSIVTFESFLFFRRGDLSLCIFPPKYNLYTGCLFSTGEFSLGVYIGQC